MFLMIAMLLGTALGKAVPPKDEEEYKLQPTTDSIQAPSTTVSHLSYMSPPDIHHLSGAPLEVGGKAATKVRRS